MSESENPQPAEAEETAAAEGAPAGDESIHPAYRLEPDDDEAAPQPPTD